MSTMIKDAKRHQKMRSSIIAHGRDGIGARAQVCWVTEIWAAGGRNIDYGNWNRGSAAQRSEAVTSDHTGM